MKKLVSLAAMILVIMTICSCGTLFMKGGSDYRDGVDAYESQEYATSVAYLVSALNTNPELIEAAELLPQAFNEGTAYYTEIITQAEKTASPEAADTVYQTYGELKEMHEIAAGYGQSTVTTTDYTPQWKESRLKASQAWTAYGDNLVSSGSREDMIAAVTAYEKAKKYDSTIADIDTKINYAIEEATIRLIVLGNENMEGFHEALVPQVQRALSSNKFVEVVDVGNFSDVESMVGPFDLAVFHGMDNDVDFVLEVYPRGQVEKLYDEQKVPVTTSNPVFDGLKISTGYQKRLECDVRLFDLATSTYVYEGSSVIKDDPVLFNITVAEADARENLNLYETGTRQYGLLVVPSADYMRASEIIDSMTADYREIISEANVYPETVEGVDTVNMMSRDSWKQYYAQKYNNFDSFARHESGRKLFYGVEAVKEPNPDGDGYYSIGSVEESFERSAITDEVVMAQLQTAENFIGKELQTKYWDFDGVGNQIMPEIAQFL